jgi:uncharacterized protein YndB with AHSA1/START domain
MNDTEFVISRVLDASLEKLFAMHADASSFPVRAPFPAHWTMEVLNTIRFEEQDGKTLLTLRGVPINASDEERQTFVQGFASMQQGFGGTLDQLAAYLAKLA